MRGGSQEPSQPFQPFSHQSMHDAFLSGIKEAGIKTKKEREFKMFYFLLASTMSITTRIATTATAAIMARNIGV